MHAIVPISMRDVLRGTVLGGLFLIPLIPLLVTSDLFFPYITGKNFAFRIIVEVIFAAWILLALYDTQFRPRFSWILGTLAAFVGVVFIADLFGMAPQKSLWSNFERMEGFVTIIHLLLYFVVAGSVVTTEKLWRYFFNTSLTVAAVVSAYAFYQLVTGGSAFSGLRIDATLGNAIYMAVYMLFHVFIALFLLVKSPERWIQILYGALAFIFAFFLLQTGTRGTFLGLLAGLCIAALYAALCGRRTVRVAAGGAILVIVLLSGLLFAARDTSFVSESPMLERITAISLTEGETRLTIWGIALEGVQERPLLGWGQGAFNYVFNTYYRPSLYDQEQWFDRVHNVYLDWLVAAGILGFLAYLALWGATFYALMRGAFTHGERAVLLGLLVGYGVHNLFVFDNLISYLFFATMLALIHARTAKVTFPSVSASSGVRTAAVPIVGVLLALTLYFVNVPSIKAAADIIDAFGYINVAQGSASLTQQQRNTLFMRGLAEFESALARGSFADQEIREHLALSTEQVYRTEAAILDTKIAYAQLAEAELLAQIEARPHDARTRTFLGTLYRVAGAYDAALVQFEAARELSPQKPRILLDIGATHIAAGAYEEAQAAFAEALMLVPEYTDARAYAIAAAIRAGDQAQIDALTKPPYEHVYTTHDLVMQTYYELEQHDAVLSILDERIARSPQNLELRITRAMVAHEAGDTAGAIQTIEAAIEDFPGFAIEGEELIGDLRTGRLE